jgi:hypothetical protein
MADGERLLSWRLALREKSVARETRALITNVAPTASKRLAAAVAILCRSLVALPDTIIAYRLVLFPLRTVTQQSLKRGFLPQ